MGPRVSPGMAFAICLSPQLGNSMPVLTGRTMQGLSRGCGLKSEEQLHPLDPGLTGLPIWRFCPCPQCVGHIELSSVTLTARFVDRGFSTEVSPRRGLRALHS